MTSSAQIPPPAYFGSLTLENVKCFQGKHEINLSDKNDKNKPAMWTVILGNNNTGKTTLLKNIADLEPIRLDSKLCIPKIVNKSPPPLGCLVKCSWFFNEPTSYDDKWLFQGHGHGISYFQVPYEVLGKTIIYGYGTSRRMGNDSLSKTENQDNTETLFNETATLINVEDWLIRVYAVKDLQPKAKETLEKIKHILISGILPDVEDFDFDADDNSIPFVKCKTDYGWIKLRELGYGYQVTLAWVVDLAKKMFERYPESDEPLKQPAIVLVDEIDLHLHPEWQRKIIQFLKIQFPKTQFIVTTHSPLIIQSMDDINLVLLEKEDDHVIIKQPDLKNYQGWTVEEILSDLMGLDGRTKSETYYKLIAAFNKAALKDDYDTAKKVYDELEAILNRNNPYRELLDLQLSRLSIPESA